MNRDLVILLVTIAVFMLFVMRRYRKLTGGYVCDRKLIVYYLMMDERIDAEYCMYLRLIYRREDDLWRALEIPHGNEHLARDKLVKLQNKFHGVEHKKVTGALHVLMAELKVEKKHEVFNLPSNVLRVHYYDFITRIKEEG